MAFTARSLTIVRISLTVLMFLIQKKVSILGQITDTIDNWSSSQDIKSAYFQRHSHHYLLAPVLRSMFVSEDIECLRECLRETNNCFSFNIAVDFDHEKNLRLCQLLKTTKYYAEELFIPRSSFHHFSLQQMTPARSCSDHQKRGAFQTGMYTIVIQIQGKEENRIVFCDLTSEKGRAWTLVLSWKLSNINLRQFDKDAFYVDAPFNDQNPNWNAYRLPKDVLFSLKSELPLWRATCNFPSITDNATLYRDYLRGNFADFDILTFNGKNQCMKVDYVNIRGHVGVKTEATFYQEGNVYFLHLSSCATVCSFNAKEGCVYSENNFGHYGESPTVRNPKFRCTSSSESTTNWWFGEE